MCEKILAFAAILIFAAPISTYAQPAAVDQQINDNSGKSLKQPQGTTGPIVTKSGGAPASSPQGDTPAGMQPDPKGSNKKVKTDQSGSAKAYPKN